MKIAVVGAGPAGIRAVEQLLRAGLTPLWIDESADGGGRIYQRPPAPLSRSPEQLYGFEARKARRIHDDFEHFSRLADWRPATLVWQVRRAGSGIELHCQSERSGFTAEQVDALLLCTGAHERVVPIPGWTLPGVTTLGGAQIAMKTQACAIGQRVVFVGTGPLLWLVAHQHAKEGVSVPLVLDTSRFANKFRAAPALFATGPATLFKGLWYTGSVHRRAGSVCEGGWPLRIIGEQAVEALIWQDQTGAEHRTECDALAMGWGLQSEARLADLAGVHFTHDDEQGLAVPQFERTGRSAVPGIYSAGDGAAIGGADLAEQAGARAALALLEDAGRPFDQELSRVLDAALARHWRLRAAIDRAFPAPLGRGAAIPDDAILCRCEAITAGELRAAAGPVAATGRAIEINRAKAFSRVGMGRCQGRMCSSAAAEVLAAHHQVPLARVGHLRAQAPVRPIPIVAAPAPSAPSVEGETS
ncbi:MAG: hypothetical protein RL322_1921 [Pseudomonadota bacterium]|jgi:NADPH-dependent 2,4-dienoyl-CoA reductase/sulfur reductase-like enzyme